MNKKSQIKIQEMVFMLIGVMMFFILIGMFGFSIFYSNLKQSYIESQRDKAISAIINLADSPEFYCGKSKTNCIDEDKLIILTDKKNMISYWPFASIRVVKYSGLNKTKNQLVECTTQNYPNCDYYSVYDKKVNQTSYSSFIALCRKHYDQYSISEKCEVAKIIAGANVNPK